MLKVTKLRLVAQIKTIPWRIKNIKNFILNQTTYRNKEYKLVYYCTKVLKPIKKSIFSNDESGSTNQ